MEIIFLSGVDTPVLLIAQLCDHAWEISRQCLTTRNPRSGSSASRRVIATPSAEAHTPYDRAA